jgi:hypothetical protein
MEAYACGMPATELHRKMDEPWQNLIGLLGHLSREVLDGQFFALIVRLVGNAMAQLIRDEQVVRFVRQRCSHVTPRRASLQTRRPVRKSDKVSCALLAILLSLHVRLASRFRDRRFDHLLIHRLF